MASLEVRSGPLAGQTIELTDEVVIGRENTDVTIDDGQISRRHAVVRRVVGAVEVEDLGSSNGTFVDDRRIEGPTRAGEGAKIRLGTTVLEVRGVLQAQATRVGGVADPNVTRARPIADPDATRARPTGDPNVTRARPIADPNVTRVRSIADPNVTKARPIAEPEATRTSRVPSPEPRSPSGAPSAPLAVPVGQFSPPGRKRRQGLASRSWIPVVLSYGTVIVVAIALVIYFHAHH